MCSSSFNRNNHAHVNMVYRREPIRSWFSFQISKRRTRVYQRKDWLPVWLEQENILCFMFFRVFLIDRISKTQRNYRQTTIEYTECMKCRSIENTCRDKYKILNLYYLVATQIYLCFNRKYQIALYWAQDDGLLLI